MRESRKAHLISPIQTVKAPKNLFEKGPEGAG